MGDFDTGDQWHNRILALAEWLRERRDSYQSTAGDYLDQGDDELAAGDQASAEAYADTLAYLRTEGLIT